MSPADTARLLGKAAAFDQRTVGEYDVAAWAEALVDVPAGDGLAAVTRHYQATRDRLMPSDVIRIADQIADERRRAALRARADAELSIAAAPQVAVGEDRSDQVRALIRQLRDALPPVDPTKYRRAEVLAWERQRQREARAEPNPHYDPTARAEESA